MRLWNAPRGVRFSLPAPFLGIAPGLLLGLALGLAAQGAGAEGEEPAESEPAWIPSLSAEFETFQYSATTSVTNLVNPPAQEGTVSGSSLQLIARIGGELMGPRLESLPTHPRLFVQGGVGFNSFSGSNIAEIGLLQGDPQRAISQFNITRAADIALGCNIPGVCPITAEPSDFEGQGSEVTAEVQTPEWNAALGLAWDIPLRRSLLLQVKPSVTYNFERVKFGGRIRTVVETDPVNEVFEIYEGTGSGSSNDHSLGLGIELDLALFRSRPIRASLVLGTRFLWLLSDPTTTFSDSSGTRTFWTTPAAAQMEPTGPVGAYRVERDGFEIRGGAGVRLSWVGFGQR